MSALEIIKNQTCAVTGHRTLYSDFDRNKLKSLLLKVAKCGINTFMIGMAVGFDKECFNVLQELKKEYGDLNIRIIACIPCLCQDKNFPLKEKQDYRKNLELADEKVVISRDYTPSCMMKRNMFMVDNSAVLVSYLRKNYGGTKNTVDYAEKKGTQIIAL